MRRHQGRDDIRFIRLFLCQKGLYSTGVADMRRRKAAAVDSNSLTAHGKKIFLFSIPLMLTGILQSLYSTADLIVVGRFDGELALAAVGSTGSLTNLI